MLILELARWEYSLRRENIIALGNSGTGKIQIALSLGLAACQKGFSVTFTTAASLVHQLMEARDEKRLNRLQRDPQAVKLLIIDELGYAPDRRPERSGAVVRSAQSALRARLHHRHLQPDLQKRS